MSTATTKREQRAFQHTAGNERTTELRAAAQIFDDYHRNWQLDETKAIPDEKYWENLDLLLENFAKGEISLNCLDLADAVNQLRVQYGVYDNREDVGNRYPHKEFWAAVELIQAALSAGPISEPNFTPLEPMPLLKSQGLSEMQIARIYEFVDSNGNPDVRPVNQELKTPGSVINDNWTDPRIVRWREEQAKKRILIENDLEKVFTQASAAPAGQKQATETVADLFAQGLSVSQTAKILDLPAGDVAAEYEQLQKEVDAKKSGKGQDQSQPAAAPSTVPLAQQESKDAEPLSIPDQIMALHVNKIDPREIANRLKIGLSQVNKTINESK